MPRLGQSIKPLVLLGRTAEDCWLWIGKVDQQTGYGHKQFGGKTVLAHRWVYEQFVGPIGDGMVINHLCSVRACVNPFHLEVITQAGNCQKGLGSVLKPDQVMEIKAAFAEKRWGDGAKLARKYGVSGALIHDIWRGRAWSNIG